MSKKSEALKDIKARFYEWTGSKLISTTEDGILEELNEAMNKLVSEAEEQERLLSSMVNEAFN